MNNDVRNMVKDSLILFAITLIAGLILGVVYQVTKEPIAVQKEKAKQEACREVFADAAGFKEAERQAQAGEENGQVSEYNTPTEGYGGDIQFMMGIRSDGTLNGISLLAISETAGLGMRAEDVLKPQFAGKSVESFEYVKGNAAAENQIDAISGATITTNALTNGVNAGLYYFRTVLGGGNGNE